MKLTKTEKESIVRSILKKKVHPLQELLKLKIHETALGYIMFRLKPFEGFIQSLPHGMLPETDNFKLRFSGAYHDRFCVSHEDRFAVPYSWLEYHSNEAELLVEEPEWLKKFRDIQTEELEIKKYREDLQRETNGVLAGINTHKQLVDIFPEVSQYIDEEQKKPFYPPVVKTDRLKALLENNFYTGKVIQ